MLSVKNSNKLRQREGLHGKPFTKPSADVNLSGLNLGHARLQES